MAIIPGRRLLLRRSLVPVQTFQRSSRWAAAPACAVEEFPKRNLQPGENVAAVERLRFMQNDPSIGTGIDGNCP